MDRKVVILLLCSMAAAAQDKGQQRPALPVPTNPKILSQDVNLLRVMQSFNAGLGVQCTYCHVAGDFASDANPKKETARKMLMVIRLINVHFPDAGNDFVNSRYLPFPEGKQYVTCYTCHQGKTKPETQHPTPVKRAPEPYAAGQGVGIPGVPPPPPGRTGMSETPDGRKR